MFKVTKNSKQNRTADLRKSRLQKKKKKFQSSKSRLREEFVHVFTDV